MSHVDVQKKKKKSYFFFELLVALFCILYEKKQANFLIVCGLCYGLGHPLFYVRSMLWLLPIFYVMDVCLLREISVDGYGVVAEP